MKKELVVTLLERMNFHTILKSGENIQVNCPFAPYTNKHRNTVDSKPSMGILVREEDSCLINCFTCSFRFGSLVHMVEVLVSFNAEFAEYLEEAKQIEHLDLDILLGTIGSFGQTKTKYEDKVLPESNYEPFANLYHPYWEKRGLRKEVVKSWNVGFDKDRRRVMIPVRNQQGYLVGAVGRALNSDDLPKYLNYWNFDKGKHLLGEDKLKANNTTILVEGAVDAIKVYQNLVDLGISSEYGVVAALGAKLTTFQIDRLISLSSEVIVALDNDVAGREGTEALTKHMSRRIVSKKFNYTADDTDPGDLTVNRFANLLETVRFLF